MFDSHANCDGNHLFDADWQNPRDIEYKMKLYKIEQIVFLLDRKR